MQLDFLSRPESHMLARPQQCSKAKVVSLSEAEAKERMMSPLAVKDWRDYKIWSGIWKNL